MARNGRREPVFRRAIYCGRMTQPAAAINSSLEKSFTLQFVEQAHIDEAGHLRTALLHPDRQVIFGGANVAGAQFG